METKFNKEEVNNIRLLLNARISDYQNTIIKFKQKIADASAETGSGISHTLEWYLDDVVKAEYVIAEMVKFKAFFEKSVLTGNKLNFYDKLHEFIVKDLNTVISYNPPRSTNPVANSIENYKHEALRNVLSICIEIFNEAVDKNYYDNKRRLEFSSILSVGLLLQDA